MTWPHFGVYRVVWSGEVHTDLGPSADLGHGGVGMIDISIADIVESRCQSWRRRGGDDVPAGAAPKAESFPT